MQLMIPMMTVNSDEFKDLVMQKDKNQDNFLHILMHRDNSEIIDFTIKKIKENFKKEQYEQILKIKVD